MFSFLTLTGYRKTSLTINSSNGVYAVLTCGHPSFSMIRAGSCFSSCTLMSYTLDYAIWNNASSYVVMFGPIGCSAATAAGGGGVEMNVENSNGNKEWKWRCK